MSKLVSSIQEAIEKSGLKSGMCISFHHHLRGGDYVLNMVMQAIADMGIRDLTVNASSLFDCHMPLMDHIRNGVVTLNPRPLRENAKLNIEAVVPGRSVFLAPVI